MPTNFSHRLTLVLAFVFVLPTAVTAQDDSDGPTPIFSAGKRPFVYAMAASANRLKDKATYMFDVAGAPNALDGILSALEDNVDGLAGIDWDRPAGMMVYLNSVFPPSFEFVAFLPVSSVAEFQSMMELGTQVLREEPNEPGRYELITPRRNIQIRIENGYAFIQMPFMEPDPTFDRELPSPETMVAGLTNQFDLGVTLDVEAVPKATRDLLTNMLTSTMSTQMQQRDEEADSTYELRKAWMQGDIDAFKLLFEECQKISLGIKVDPEQRNANIDFVLDVKNGGQLLEEILASTTKPSYFSPLLDDEAPVSISWSGIMAQRDIDRYTNSLEASKAEVARIISENEVLGAPPQQGSPLFQAMSALQQTISDGNLDMFGQMYRDADEKVAVVLALRVQDGEAIAGGLGDLLGRATGVPDVEGLTLNSNEHENVSFHRLQVKDAGAAWQEVFGAGAGAMIGCAPRTMWVCLGGDKSFDVMTNTMDALVAAYENPTQARQTSAMRVIVHTNELINMVNSARDADRKAKDSGKSEEELVAEDKKKSSGQSERQARIQAFRDRRDKNNKLFVEALAEGEDLIEMSARPTDHGMRMRTVFGEGFIRGVGRMIGTRFED